MLSDLRVRLRALFRRKAVEAELEDELHFHLERETEKYAKAGVLPQEAHRRARVELGGLEQAKEDCRDARGVRFVETLSQDVRFGLRMLRKSPGFMAVAILTLALGIGANTALFSVVNGVLLNPLPYPEPNQLVVLARRARGSEAAISYPDFLDWERMNHTFEAMAAYKQNVFNLTGSGKAEHVKSMRVSASFFPLLGVKPVIGRNFSAKDDRPGAAPVVMLSGGFWKSKFGGSPSVLGKTITLDGMGYTVIGVVPENFYFCCESTNFSLGDVYVPLGAWNDPSMRDRSSKPGIWAVGRMKPGVTTGQARADMDRVAADLAAAYPGADKDAGIALTPLKAQVVQGARTMLLVLLAAVGFVLLIACANVASLLLVRATGRAREFAIRAALGAGRERMIRQLLAESLLLAIGGGGLGVLIALCGTRAALAALPAALPRANDVGMDGHVLIFALAVSLLAGIVFGLAPAVLASRPNLHEMLKEGGRGSSGAQHGTQRVFVTAEMALAVVLLIGAGLTLRSLANLWSVNPGFDPRNVLTFSVALPPSMSKETPAGIRASLLRLAQSVAAIPGVKAASLTDGAMPLNGDEEFFFWIEGQPRPATDEEMPVTLFYLVGPNYLKVMGIPLLRGRFFTPADTAHSPKVCVIDEDFARKYFAKAKPIGEHVVVDEYQQCEIIGVVGHVKQFGLESDASGPVKAQLYVPVEQMPDKFTAVMATGQGLVVRTQTASYPGEEVIRSAMGRMNDEQTAYGFESMDEIIAHLLASRRFAMILLGAFGAAALVLASIGLYGVISYVADQRTHEIGVRVALGAQRADVFKLVLGEAARMTLIGVVLGLAVAAASTRVMKSFLFGIGPVDPVTYASVAAALTAVALAACYLPARRAMRVDPVTALRNE